MLILTRRVGQSILAGYSIRRDDPEGSADTIIVVGSITGPLDSPAVSVEVEDSLGGRTVILDNEEAEFTAGQMSVRVLGLRVPIHPEGGREPSVVLGFTADNSYKILRSEVEPRE